LALASAAGCRSSAARASSTTDPGIVGLRARAPPHGTLRHDTCVLRVWAPPHLCANTACHSPRHTSAVVHVPGRINTRPSVMDLAPSTHASTVP
jgi:hypothetical protein